MNQALLRYEWNALPWPRLEKSVFKLQKRIFQASQRGDVQLLRKLQKLLLHSTSAKLLATRRVTQDNQGKNTAGVDGIASLKPDERLELVSRLSLDGKSRPVRRVWIPKPGKPEKRPLGIPTMEDRAKQALVKLALEPEWEARFEPNSYGFRPGRSCHDAVEAIFGAVKNKNAYVLDADISGCFDNIDQTALLEKLNTTPRLRRVIKGWLKAGVLEGDVYHKTENGTPQGGVISPLLANVALHGLENDTKEALDADLRTAMQFAAMQLSIIRYADDFVVLHKDLDVVMKAKAFIEEWLKGVGLELKPSKTRVGHTLEEVDGKAGFQFLGFEIRQHRVTTNKLGYKTLIKPSKEAVKRHLQSIRQELRALRGAPQVAVIAKLNPIVKGWSRYYVPSVARKVFEYCSDQMHQKLWRWAMFRHPHKGEQWVKRKYFRTHGNDQWRFMTHGGQFLMRHQDHAIKRHVKVIGTKSPYDGDWPYWSLRSGRVPGVSPRVTELMKLQKGRCAHCGLFFRTDDLLEVHHKDGNHSNNMRSNLALLHRHCHDDAHGRGVYVKHRATEEPDDSKGSSPVLESSREG
jgi:RNA-directed DNA polymerase